MPLSDQIREYWDIDSATYDDSASHRPRTAFELAAWASALRRLLPPPPAKVLDVGAGTGFLSILLARAGFEVTAVDLSTGMLDRLRSNAEEAGVQVTTHEGDATHPPAGSFDAVVERHLLWTLPEPSAAVEAWHGSAPDGRLLLLESLWGPSAGLVEQLRHAAQSGLRRLRGAHHDHHAEYDASMRSELPFGSGTTPETLLRLVESSSWRLARVERLRDVEWASRAALATPAERLIGVSPRFAVIGGR